MKWGIRTREATWSPALKSDLRGIEIPYSAEHRARAQSLKSDLRGIEIIVISLAAMPIMLLKSDLRGIEMTQVTGADGAARFVKIRP